MLIHYNIVLNCYLNSPESPGSKKRHCFIEEALVRGCVGHVGLEI